MRLFLSLLLTVTLLLTGRVCLPLENFSFFIQYSVNDGLASSRIFDVMQDSRGYIWFATENGVSRFNGYEFRNFTTADGLPANSTIRVLEDPQGRVWFMSYQGPLSYFAEGRILPFPGNPLLKERDASFISNIYFEDDTSMLLIHFNGGMLKVSRDSLVTPVPNPETPVDSIYILLEKRVRGTFTAFFNAFPGAPDAPRKSGRINDSTWTFKRPRGQTDNHLNCLDLGDQRLLSFGRNLFRVEGERLILVREFEDEITRLEKDRRGRIWISVKFNGVYMFAQGLGSGPDYHYFKGKTVSGILHDREGNYWFTTSERGVYFVPSLDLSMLTGPEMDARDHGVVALEVFGDELFFSTDRKMTYHGNISGNRISHVRPLHPNVLPINHVNAILCTAGDSVYISADFNPLLPDSIIPFTSGRFTVFPVEYGYSLHRTLSGDILLGHFNGVQQLRGDRILRNVSYHNKGFRVFDAIQTPDSTIFLGTISGLLELRGNEPGPLVPDDPVLGSRISKLVHINDRLWVGTFDFGIAILAGDTVRYLNTGTGLSSNRIKAIYPQNDSITWVGTNMGLNRVTITGSDPIRYQVLKLDIWDGLPSNEINEVKAHEGFLWVATDKGIVFFDPGLVIDEHDHPTLVLDRVVLDPDEELPASRPARLKYNQNTITLEFHGITFRNPRETVYRYTLEGLSDEWNETKNTSVRFHDLDPGSYTFHIRAIGTTGHASETVSYRFVIGKHFTQTTGFLVLVILSGALAVFFVARYLILTQKRRLELQRKIFLAEQKAMLAQMNPHFIFNSLNSIQNFILENDHVTANQYLVTFSSLIRKVLDASQKNFISLKEELDIVKLYLELEKFRFQGRFDYTLNVGKRINPDQVSIPSMILQPFLENAIWHGLMPKKGGGGLVELDVMRKDEGHLTVTIADNGIGRERSGEINRRRKQHNPTGMRNVEERIRLLNELNNSNLAVHVVDLYDKEGKGCGTRVEIELED